MAKKKNPTHGYTLVVGERTKKGRRKKGAVKVRILSYSETKAGRHHERDEEVELRPGDSIRTYFKGFTDGVEDVMVFEATILPPE